MTGTAGQGCSIGTAAQNVETGRKPVVLLLLLSSFALSTRASKYASSGIMLDGKEPSESEQTGQTAIQQCMTEEAYVEALDDQANDPQHTTAMNTCSHSFASHRKPLVLSTLVSALLQKLAQNRWTADFAVAAQVSGGLFVCSSALVTGPDPHTHSPSAA